MVNREDDCVYDEKYLIMNLVNIEKFSDKFVIDMKYASENNFTGKKIYTLPLCALQKRTAQKLIEANKELMNKCLRIKIWDAYRPLSAQKLMWDIMPVHDYDADPSRGGSIHNSGFAVDVTIVDMQGKELEMPSGFDDFSDKASRKNLSMSEAAAKNLAILTYVMVKHGFRTIDSEWWHYYDSDLKERIPLDIPLENIATA
jgi:D-alanyl-D-alanine dipeptidase